MGTHKAQTFSNQAQILHDAHSDKLWKMYGGEWSQKYKPKLKDVHVYSGDQLRQCVREVASSLKPRPAVPSAPIVAARVLASPSRLPLPVGDANAPVVAAALTAAADEVDPSAAPPALATSTALVVHGAAAPTSGQQAPTSVMDDDASTRASVADGDSSDEDEEKCRTKPMAFWYSKCTPYRAFAQCKKLKNRMRWARACVRRVGSITSETIKVSNINISIKY